MRKIIPFFLAFSLVFSGAALATPAVDAAGAATLKKQIDDELQWRFDMAKIIGQGLVTEGKTEVTPKSGFYEVTLPHLYLVGSDHGKLDAGRPTLNVAPAEAGAWQIQQVTLPSTMIFYDAQNKPAITISIGSNHFTATWRPDQDLYPKLDSLIENIRITSANNGPSIKIAALKTFVDLKDNGDSTWSGPADFGATGITVDVPGQNPLSVSADKVTARNNYDRLDVSETFRTKQMAKASLKSRLPQTDQEKKAFVAKLLTKHPFNAEGLSNTFEIDKFVLHDTGSKQQPQRVLSLDKLALSSLSPNMKQKKTKLMVKTAFEGLHISYIPTPLSSLIPVTANAELTLNNLPAEQIIDQFYSLIKKQADAAALGPAAEKIVHDTAKTDAANALSQIPKILEDAGTSIAIHDTYMKNNDLSTSIDTDIAADAKATLGVTGKVTVVIKGLDELVQRIQAVALKPGTDPHMLGYLMGFMTVDTKGKPDKAADGSSIRNYVVEIKKNGDVSLNGNVVTPPKQPAPATP